MTRNGIKHYNEYKTEVTGDYAADANPKDVFAYDGENRDPNHAVYLSPDGQLALKLASTKERKKVADAAQVLDRTESRDRARKAACMWNGQCGLTCACDDCDFYQTPETSLDTPVSAGDGDDFETFGDILPSGYSVENEYEVKVIRGQIIAAFRTRYTRTENRYIHLVSIKGLKDYDMAALLRMTIDQFRYMKKRFCDKIKADKELKRLYAELSVLI